MIWEEVFEPVTKATEKAAKDTTKAIVLKGDYTNKEMQQLEDTTKSVKYIM